jgi:hypothetical protein
VGKEGKEERGGAASSNRFGRIEAIRQPGRALRGVRGRHGHGPLGLSYSPANGLHWRSWAASISNQPFCGSGTSGLENPQSRTKRQNWQSWPTRRSGHDKRRATP